MSIATEAGSLEVALEWDDVDGAARYWVRWRSVDTGEKLNEGVEVETSQTTITVADYGDWVVRVQACNDTGCGKPNNQRFTVEPEPSVPGQPANLAVVATSGQLGLSATWDALEDADFYNLAWRPSRGDFEAGNSATVITSDATITVSGYGQWVVKLEGCNDAGCGPGVERPVGIAPGQPDNLVVRATPGELDLSATWDVLDGATLYKLSWLPAAGDSLPDRDAWAATSNAVWVSTNSADFTVDDYGQWFVRLEGCNDAGCGPAVSQTVELLLLDLPQNFMATAEPGELVVLASWDEVEGATSYNLRWRQSGGEFEAANAITVSKSQAVITVSDYGQWEISLQACNDDGCGPEVSQTVDAMVPAIWLNLAQSRDTEGQVRPRTFTVSWDPVEGATSYILSWRRAGDDPPAPAPLGGASRQTRSMSGDDGQRANTQEQNRLNLPGDRTSAEFNVPDDGEYRANLEARNDENEVIGQGDNKAKQGSGQADTTPPRLVRGEIDGDTMTLYFSEPLDENSVEGDFNVTVSRDSPQGGWWMQFIAHPTKVEVSGNKVVVVSVLGSSYRVAVGDRVRVFYFAYGGDERLRDLVGNVVWTPHRSLDGRFQATRAIDLDNLTAPPALQGAMVRSRWLTMTFDESLDGNSVPAAGAFTVTVNGSPVSLASIEPVIVSGHTVTLVLASPVSTTDVVTVSYAKPSTGKLRGPDGEAESFSSQPVDNLRLESPAVSGVAITSDPGDDDTYAHGEAIQVTATFTEAVNVDTTGGAPRLKIRMAPHLRWFDTDHGARWADYTGGSGTAELTFTYTVTEANYSVQGVAVLGDALELNGGAIRSVAMPPTDAHLYHRGLRHDRNHKVDGQTPTLQGVAVSGKTVSLTFSEALDPYSVPPASAFTVKRTPEAGSEETVSLSGAPAIAAGAVILTLADPVAGTDTGVKVSYARPASGAGNPLQDPTGNEAASFTDQAADATDTTPPRLVRGEIQGDTLTIYFSEPLDEEGVGGFFRLTLWSVDYPQGHGQCRTIRSTFTVEPRDVYISGNTAVVVGLYDEKRYWPRVDRTIHNFHYIRPNSFDATAPRSTKGFQDLAGNVVSTTVGTGDHLRTRHITLEDVTWLPSPVRVTVVGDRLTMIFDAPLDGDSRPAASAFTVKVNGSVASLASANPVSLSGYTVTLTLAAPVAEGDVVTVSYERPAHSWLRNEICEYAVNFSDVSAMNFTGTTAASVAITSDAGDDDTYGLGETVRATLTFSEAVNVAGKPRLKIKMAPDARESFMWYESGSGANRLTFARKVLERTLPAQQDISATGIAVLANSLELSDGSISYASSGKPAYLAHAGLSHDPNHKVDWRRPAPGVPSISNVEITSDPGDDSTYGQGDAIRATLTFSEAVDVDTTAGAPRLRLYMYSRHWSQPKGSNLEWAVYESGSGTSELTFAYTVEATNRSSQGVAVMQHFLELNGGSIRSAATQTDAHLWYAGLGHDPEHKVNGGL